ncbi:MAG: NUDIX hydrolase [Calothrix sp. FI2-JRJ7]|jgi:8-oxo-dGTP pyrophosphatase MutT (NUDIX family)|nr:NUDIX hydrolase [Calothrix sp. FI2-JRJ7]
MAQKTKKVLQQSGVIPYRVQNGATEILLITTRNQQNWVVPKGGVVNGMSAPDSAAKEAWEEAGVIGQVNPNQLGTYKYQKNGKTYSVQMYSLPVEVESEKYPEVGQRVRRWVNVNEAVRQVKKSSLKRILKKFVSQAPFGTDYKQM